ncbi:hypothetical protein ACZ90_25010 [Streptomyces albus subsp. albus]|nr:hypothetical protein ACZ90_25010 [Streptomyces albus subsp. albus]
MAFDDEWARYKADAAAGTSGGTRLDHVPDGPGNRGKGAPDLMVYADDLGAIGSAAFTLHERLRKAGDITRGAEGDGNTATAARVLAKENLVTGSALSTTSEVWNSQLKTVLQACATISDHLDYSVRLHSQEDKKIAASMPVSEISKYFR